MSVWHGSADPTVKPTNADEILKQWADVHGLAEAPAVVTTVDGYLRRVWRNADGEDALEAYTITGMAHGAPIAVGATDGGCGHAAPFILDAGISSTYRIAQFWDLAAVMPEAAQAASRSEHRNWNRTRQVPPSGLVIDEDGRVLEAGPAPRRLPSRIVRTRPPTTRAHPAGSIPGPSLPGRCRRRA